MMKKLGAMRKISKEAGNCKTCYYHKLIKADDMIGDAEVDDCLEVHKPAAEAVLTCKGRWVVEY